MKSEVDVKSILEKDGIEISDFSSANQEICNLDAIIAAMPQDKSWSKTIVDSESNSVTLLAQLPGEGNRLHYHPDWSEWWYILRGPWKWEIDNHERTVKTGDFVFMRKGRKHKITASGDSLSIRMAVSRYDVEHVYP
jgi:quercetin dioxygenase-like cupin family protein